MHEYAYVECRIINSVQFLFLSLVVHQFMYNIDSRGCIFHAVSISTFTIPGLQLALQVRW